MGFPEMPASVSSYCANDMSKRSIPPIENLPEKYKLLQVQVLIRHGSRIPSAPFYCWDGYDHNFNCEVTELVAPSSPSSLDWKLNPPSVVFRKRFDAFVNEYGETCYMGQLTDQGYVQQVLNGRFLRDAYIGKGSTKLFDSADLDQLPKQRIYLRGDTIQRTLQSGQTLVNSMFNETPESILEWHTGDWELDTIYQNSNVYPCLDDMWNVQTPPYQDYVKSAESQQLYSDLKAVFGDAYTNEKYLSGGELQDCLLCNLCNGRDVPSGATSELIDTFMQYKANLYGFGLFENGSIRSKLAMKNLVNTISSNMIEIVSNSTDQNTLKFALFSGHDSTIMPFLAAVAPDAWKSQGFEWAPYAALISLELYVSSDKGELPLVRMVYNGNVLRPQGCSSDLCPLEMFLGVATAFAFDDNLSCASLSTVISQSNETLTTSWPAEEEGKDLRAYLKDGDDRKGGKVFFWASAFLIVGFIGGLIFTTYMQEKKSSNRNKKNKLYGFHSKYHHPYSSIQSSKKRSFSISKRNGPHNNTFMLE